MALQVFNFNGFETGGLEEAGGTAGTPVVTTTNARAPSVYNLNLAASDNYHIVLRHIFTPTAADNYIIGFDLFIEATTLAHAGILKVADSAAAVILTISLNSSGNLLLLDANGDTLDTSVGTYDDDAYHLVEVYADLNSASADWEWFIDDVSEGSGSGADLTNGNSLAVIRLKLLGEADPEIYIDNIYVLNGARWPHQRLGHVEVIGYQNGAGATATPDGGLSGIGTSGGDALTTGTWDIVDDTPRTGVDTADYGPTDGEKAGSVDTDHSTRGGPSGDSDIDSNENIKAQKLVARMSKGTGTLSLVRIGIGDSGDTDVADVPVTPSTSEGTLGMLTEDVPQRNQRSRHGFGADDLFEGYPVHVHEMWSMILHHSAIAVYSFLGFETGGLEEADSVAGTPTVTTTNAVAPSIYNLHLAASDDYRLRIKQDPIEQAAGQDAKWIIGFDLFIEATTAAHADMVMITDSAPSTVMSIALNSSGNLLLKDANGGILDTSVGTYDDDTYHTIEVYAELDSASAIWEWFIDDVSEGSGSGADLTNGNSLAVIRLKLLGEADPEIYIDNIYVLNGARWPHQRLGHVEVIGYQNGAGATATPDGGLSGIGTSGGDALTTGTWDIVDDTPRTGVDTADYGPTDGEKAGSVDTDHSTRGGPSGDSDIDGDSNIRAQKLIARLSKGTGTVSFDFIGIGDSGDTDIFAISIDLTASEKSFTHLTRDVPTASQFCRHGVGTDELITGWAHEIHEMWSMVLHVPAVPVTVPQLVSHFMQPNPNPIRLM